MDPSVAAILAAPGDEAPRLRWAERAGGERGELVRVQAALARRDLPREERRRARARERELLSRVLDLSYASALTAASASTILTAFPALEALHLARADGLLQRRRELEAVIADVL